MNANELIPKVPEPSSPPANRFPTVVMVVIAVGLALINAVISALMVALAVPGSGEIGPGFTVILRTFAIGNLVLLIGAIVAARHRRKLIQGMGITVQCLTIPICIGAALLVMQILGISDL